jgi:GNAT superfamily N-acetyltransferase
MESVVIKQYQEGYKNELIELILDIQRNEFSIPITREDQPDLSNIPNFYQIGAGNFWVALCSGKVIGTAALLDIGNNQAALRKLFVNQAYRGGQYRTGKLLLESVLNWAAEREVKEIFLGTTAKFLAAHRFYEKNGFVEISKQSLPIAFPIMKVDTKFYYYGIKESIDNK